jgi:hypothetical protein
MAPQREQIPISQSIQYLERVLYRRRILQLKGAVRMSSNINKKQADKNAAKKAVVLGAGKKSRVPILVCCRRCLPDGCWGSSSTSLRKAAIRQRLLPPRRLLTASWLWRCPSVCLKTARHAILNYTDGALTIRYFILKSSDGIIRAAFDACDVCWPAGKGYFQDGDHSGLPQLRPQVCIRAGQRGQGRL